MDADARLEAVEAENDMLRARVDTLERALGLQLDAPVAFGLTASEARVRGVLLNRDHAGKETIMLALYGGLHQQDEAEIKIVDVFVCKMRKKLKRFGIEIETVWGRGYRMTPEMKVAARAYFDEPGAEAAEDVA